MAGRGRFKDITGKTFAYWTVKARAGSNKRGAVWICECVCGARKAITTIELSTRETTSCGCSRGTHRHTAGYKVSPTFRSWSNMIARCTQPSNPAFAHYKTRGI